MSGSDHKENRNNDYPSITEADWYVLAIVSSILTFVGAGFALWWILHGVYPDQVAERATIAGMVVTFGGVVTTFCTVAWRGMITTRQADLSIEQIAETRRQISVTEENNLASIMQKGAELIADEDSPSKVSAGISSLHTVLISTNKNYATVAQSLLVALVREEGKQCHNGRIVKQAINALNASYRDVRSISDEVLKFTENEELALQVDDYYTNWIVIYGVSSVIYNGGNIKNQDVRQEKDCYIIFRYIDFENCYFENLSNIAFEKCKFTRCTIDRVHTSDLSSNDFISCDFSDAKIVFNSGMPDMKEKGNFFYENHPPQPISNTGKPVVWSDVLLEPPLWVDMGRP